MLTPVFKIRASALLIALWAVFLVSAIVLAWAGQIGGGIEADGEANRSLEAKALAHSGVAVALHPGVSRVSPLLRRDFGNGEYYSVSIASEGSRVNLNDLLAGAEPEKIAFLKRVLAAHGLTLAERERLVDCLLDWVNPSTGMRRPNGRLEGPDYRPPHRPLQSLDEVALVEGCAPLVRQPGWKDHFTLQSAGPLDVEGASAELLALVPGVGEQRAAAFVKLRQERERRGDGKPLFGSFEEALAELGIPPEQSAGISRILGFRDPVRRITSVGTSGDVRWRAEALAGKNGDIILWTENKD